MNVDDFMPNEEERYAPLVARIPSGWGRWISIGPGWAELVIKLDKDIAAIDPEYELHQCKEKYGSLRYYIAHHHNLCEVKDPSKPWDCTINLLIKEAEAQSVTICEDCGKPGKMMVRHHWYSTVCEDHREDYEELETDDDDS